MPPEKSHLTLIRGGDERDTNVQKAPEEDRLSQVIGGIQQRFATFVQGDMFRTMKRVGMEIQKMTTTLYLRKDDPDILINKIQEWINSILEEGKRSDELFVQVKRKQEPLSEWYGLKKRIEEMAEQSKGNMRFRVHMRKGDGEKVLTEKEVEEILAPGGVKESGKGIIGSILYKIFGNEKLTTVRSFLQQQFPKAEIVEK